MFDIVILLMTNIQTPPQMPIRPSSEDSYEALTGLGERHQRSVDEFTANVLGIGVDPAVDAKHTERDALEALGIEFDSEGNHVPHNRDREAERSSEQADWDGFTAEDLVYPGIAKAVRRDRTHSAYLKDMKHQKPLKKRDEYKKVPEPRSHVGRVRPYKGLMKRVVELPNNVVDMAGRRAAKHPRLGKRTRRHA
jgi:hypothetical protein